jgi:ketose-bisphosphate aldolases
MRLISSKDLLEHAKEANYAVVAFNIHNLETLRAVIEAASELKSPVILQTTPGTVKYAGLSYLHAMADVASKENDIPVVLHLDHAEDYDLIVRCIDSGYTSVMIDGSKLPFDENVAAVRRVVEYAHPRGVQVEAELGRLVGAEDDLNVSEYESSLTNPDLAAEFAEKTGIDSLAVAIGTAHGLYKGTPRLDYDRLKEIKKRVSIPLVLHGASDVPDDMIAKAVEYGINKINIATDIKIAFVKAMKKYLEEHPEESDPRKYFTPAIEAAKEVAKHKISLAGCKNRA